MSVDFLLSAFEGYAQQTAIVWRDRKFSFEWLQAETRRWIADLSTRDDIGDGTVVALCADYSPQSIALLLALLDLRCIVAPITEAFSREKDDFMATAQVAIQVAINDSDEVSFSPVGHKTDHPLLIGLRDSGNPGVVLFSSGSTGKSKAVVHDGARLLAKYRTPRRATVTIPFMLFDHIGGLNTVLHVLSSGGTAVIATDRSPDAIGRLVEAFRVEVLPTSPTFVNLFLLGAPERYDLSSLKVLAYGAERMPASTLQRLAAALPHVELIQNYGLSEVGIMRTKSESSDSLWVKLGGDGFETRVRDGLLEIKAATAMVGYLNEASPFTDDGWLKTGDRVDVKGEYVRILGRQSDLIFVGGEKVYPAEVEDAIAALDGVIEVVVRGEPNAITGQIVHATVRLSTDETRTQFRKRMNAAIAGSLATYKLPQRVKISQVPLHNARGKRVRN